MLSRTHCEQLPAIMLSASIDGLQLFAAPDLHGTECSTAHLYLHKMRCLTGNLRLNFCPFTLPTKLFSLVRAGSTKKATSKAEKAKERAKQGLKEKTTEEQRKNAYYAAGGVALGLVTLGGLYYYDRQVRLSAVVYKLYCANE